MSNKQKFPSDGHLFELIGGRKYKQYKPYIQEIENQTPEAEQAVSHNLLHILVEKKYKDPMMMFNALVLYKHLLVGATMDFICNQELFPLSIHKEVAKICQYKGTEKDIKARGNQYFVELFKTEPNEQTSSYGYNYMMLALEILKSMAVWYPFDYENSKEKSVFKIYYDKLLQKNCFFPDHKDFLLIKPADQELFKKNYQRFLSNLQGNNFQEQKLEQPVKSQPKQPIKKQIKPPLPVNPPEKIKEQSIKPLDKTQPKQLIASVKKKSVQNKIADAAPSGVKPKQQSSPKKQNNQKPKMESSGKSQVPIVKQDIQMVTIPNKVIQSIINQPPPSKPAQISEKKIIVKKQQPKSNIIPPNILFSGNTLNLYPDGSIDPNTKFNFATVPQSNPSGKAAFVTGIKEEPKSKLIQPQKPKLTQPQKVKVPQPSKKKLLEPEKRIPAPNTTINSSITKPVVARKEETVPKTNQKQIAFVPINPPNSIKVIPETKPINRQWQRMPADSLFVADSSLDQPVFSFNNKTAETFRHQTPRKILKIEKPKQYQSIQKRSQNIVQPIISFDSSPRPISTNRPRSIPKTEKKLGTTFHTNFGFDQFKSTLGMASPPTKQYKEKQVFNKTLSYFTTSRKKTYRNNQLQRYNSLLQVVDKMRLDKTTLRFVSKYYQPVTPAMTMLREQALNLYGSGANYSPFYIGKGIEARVIKQINNQFVLTLHNLTTSTLLIEYFNMHQLNHSKRIKIITWANKKQPSPYRLQPNKYFDVKFHVQIYDLNFKFLNFSLRIEGVLQQFVLPITLLDMCDIQSTVAVSHLQKYALKGSIITSQPFRLNFNGLPSFLGGFKFFSTESARQRREDSVLIGQCGLKFQKSTHYQSGQSDLHILIKSLQNETRTVQIEILYITKDTEAQDLAKVILYLFIFLLQNE